MNCITYCMSGCLIHQLTILLVFGPKLDEAHNKCLNNLTLTYFDIPYNSFVMLRHQLKVKVLIWSINEYFKEIWFNGLVLEL